MKRWPLLALALAGACNLHGFNNGGGGAINLAASGDYVLAARGSAGLDVLRASDGARVGHLDPSGESDSVDDLAVDGDRVVLLDADSGRLSSYRLGADGALTPRTRDLRVDASPYSGVTAVAGRVVVSGGTCGIASFDLAADGALSPRGTLRAFRGQPEVSALPGVGAALLSTHFSGSSDEFVDGAEFGVSSLRVDALAVVDTRGLAGAGFTEGGGRPSSWPVRGVSDGDLAYVAHGGGLDVMRVGADLSLTRLSHLALPTPAVDVAVRGGVAYVVGASPPSLLTLDVRDPAQPRVTRRDDLDASARPSAVLATDDAVYIAAGPAGLLRRPR